MRARRLKYAKWAEVEVKNWQGGMEVVAKCDSCGTRLYTLAEKASSAKLVEDGLVRVIGPMQAYDVFRPLLESAQVEKVMALFLASDGTLLGDPVLLVQGALNKVMILPRELLRPAIERGAARIVMAHNHPSGGLTPSDEDRALTERMAASTLIMGIELVDHLIISRRGYKSFSEEGWMP